MWEYLDDAQELLPTEDSNCVNAKIERYPNDLATTVLSQWPRALLCAANCPKRTSARSSLPPGLSP
jgi:hypothetical protein